MILVVKVQIRNSHFICFHLRIYQTPFATTSPSQYSNSYTGANMDHAAVNERLSDSPSSNTLLDQLLSDRAALVESSSYTQLTEPPRTPVRSTNRRNSSSTTSEDSWKNECSSSWDICNLEYVGDVDENLMCPICHSPFVSPISLQCQHIFCNSCLMKAMDHQQDINKICPSCRTPTGLYLIVPVPKVIHRILDETRVKCPLSSKGCTEILPRGTVQTHLDRYCGYEETFCPSDDCDQLVPRRLAQDNCLHKLVGCPDCSEEISSLEMSTHQDKYCEVAATTCPDCSFSIWKQGFNDHKRICSERLLPCTAAEFGCEFIGKQESKELHTASCPLVTLAPIIRMQNSRLLDHAMALKNLQRKTSLHDAFLDTVKDTLAKFPPGDLGAQAFPSHSMDPTQAQFDSPSSHLLSLHETLREEVERVSAAVSNLDAKTDTAFLNSSLRGKEEAAHRDAIIAQLRVQVQWLVSSRLQGIHMSRSTDAVLGSGTRRDGGGDEPGPSTPRLNSLTRRGSDGLGTGGRQKL